MLMYISTLAKKKLPECFLWEFESGITMVISCSPCCFLGRCMKYQSINGACKLECCCFYKIINEHKPRTCRQSCVWVYIVTKLYRKIYIRKLKQRSKISQFVHVCFILHVQIPIEKGQYD